MEQISLPMRIALAVTFVFAALWFVALRPKPVDTSATPAATPAATSASDTGAGTAVTDRAEQAADAVAGANATSAAREKAADAVGSTPAPKAAAGTKTGGAATQGVTPVKEAKVPAIAEGAGSRKVVSSGKLSSKTVLADIAAGKVVVLLFWNANGSVDDRLVRLVLPHVDRYDGKVRVYAARMSQLANFEAITKGTPITTSPTVLVIDRQSKARVIGGITTALEIDAAVARALKVK